MFTIDELIIKPGDQIGDLIEDRARLFLDKTGSYPTTAFIPPDLYRDFIRELAYNNRHNFSSPRIPSANQHNQIAFQTHLGTIKFKVITEVKSFLLVGTENTYAELDYAGGVPRELWSDSSRRKFDEDFEREVLS